MAKANIMTQAEYARHRGCSRVSVHKAIEAGRITLIGGKIDATVADLQWSANTRARVTANKPKAPQSSFPGSSALLGESDDQEPEGKGQEYWESRSRREAAEAAIAEMKEAEMRGALIRVDAVRSAWAGRATSTRDALLQIPARLAPVLAAETDMERVCGLLEEELRQALLQLSETKGAEAVA